MSCPEKKTSPKSRKGRKMAVSEVNSEPLFGTDDVPYTEELDSGDDLAMFVSQKRKGGHRKPDQGDGNSTGSDLGPIGSSVQYPECVAFADGRRFSTSKYPRENYIFVANLTRNMTADFLKRTFNQFGMVMDVNIVCRDSNSQPFAYVAFKEPSSAAAAQAMEEVPAYQDKCHTFRVEPRKTFPFVRPNQSLPITSRPDSIIHEPSQSHSLPHAMNINDAENQWHQVMANFNWKPCASKYLSRTVTMEDYLVEYIHTQASYRQLDQEPINEMIQRLKDFAVTKPKDLIEMMPPSVSGVVYNQSRERGDYLDTLGKLLPQDKIKIEGNDVYYISRLSQENARQKLKEILVEGLFVYFFAKFCHGPRFKITLPYYQRNEPIRSTLLALTGTSDVQKAIFTYFDLYSEIFIFDDTTFTLTMSRDYFDKSRKEEMAPYLDEPCHKHPVSRQSYSASPVSCPSIGTPEKGEIKRGLKRDYFNVRGHIKRLLEASKGEIEFQVDGETLSAYFKRKDTYIDGKRMTADMKLSDVFALKEDVFFNANVATSGDCQWNCTNVWVGKAPIFIEKMKAAREGGEHAQKICRGLKGRIKTVLGNKKSGYVRLILDGKPVDAYFSNDVYYNKGNEDLSSDDVGREIYVDLERQTPHRGIFYKAVHMWNNETSIQHQNDQESLSRHIEELLEPVEVTESIKLQIFEQELPFTVVSVLQDVFKEDHGHKILSNPLCIDGVLNHMARVLDSSERSKLKVQIEREIRKILAKCLAERFK